MTQETLKEFLRYDKHTGDFIWIKKTHGRSNMKNGDKAGFIDYNGYVIIKLFGKSYKAHRLAWLYHYGNFPKQYIDHINHNKIDNSIKNLRDVELSANQRNRKLSKNNTSGINGVAIVGGRWTAKIALGKNKITIGSYDSKEEAIDARRSANIKHDFHVNHGKTLKHNQ